MLYNLNIKDLAVVESLDLDLEPGLTVLTGETGAGKSILLTALALALGDRADSGYIRPGAAKAEVSLAFSLADAPDARAWLDDNDLLDEDDICLIRRVVNPDGRSKACVNNRPVTLQALQELASSLVEIHGQHAHLHLLRADEQRRILDRAGEHADRVEALEKQSKELEKSLASERLSEKEPELATRLKAVEFQTLSMQKQARQIEALEGVTVGVTSLDLEVNQAGVLGDAVVDYGQTAFSVATGGAPIGGGACGGCGWGFGGGNSHDHQAIPERKLAHLAGRTAKPAAEAGGRAAGHAGGGETPP